MQSRRDLMLGLKRIGEAPIILDEKKTVQTTENLRTYYYKKDGLITK